MNMQSQINEKINLKEEAQKYFESHYPRASKKEIEKQVLDWRDKISSGKSLVEFFKDRVGPIDGKKILDVGFGSGGITIAFSRAGAIMSGVDVDLELKDIAERNTKAHNVTVDLKIYNGSEVPFPDNYFDYVTSSSVLEHVSFPEELLNEMLRVTKSGGRIFLSLPNKYYPKETHTLAYFVSYMPRKMANVYLKLLRRSPLEDDNLHFYSYFDIVKMLKKAKYKYELVYKNPEEMYGIKKVIALILKKLNIHYTVFLRQLIFVIEKLK